MGEEEFIEEFIANSLKKNHEGDGKSIKVGPLLLELREPFKRWRLTIRGILRYGSVASKDV